MIVEKMWRDRVEVLRSRVIFTGPFSENPEPQNVLFLFFLGSVAERVIECSDIPALVVK